MFSIDLRTSILEFSLLEITNHFKAMKAGEIMEIIGIDGAGLAELKGLLPDKGWEQVVFETMGQTGALFRLRLKKVSMPSVRKPRANARGEK